MSNLPLAAILFALLPTAAFAWGSTGHRITGAVAEKHAGIRARACLRAFLGTESLASASTWGDEIRSEPKYAKVSPWHYVELAESAAPGATIAAPPEGNAVTALADAERTLLDARAAFDDRANALRLIAHFITDLHQPLHVGNGLDRGGNSCEVVFFGERSDVAPAPATPTGPRTYRKKVNLHWVWDEGLIDRSRLSYTEYAANLERTIDRAVARAESSGDLRAWIEDTRSVRDSVYPKPRVPSPRGPHPYCVNVTAADDRLPADLALPDLAWEYAHAMQPILDRQLRRAGLRLAATLDRLAAKLDCAKVVRAKPKAASAPAITSEAVEFRY